MDASGSYERLDYYRNQELFSLDGLTSFNVTINQFTNFFQNYTLSVSSSDQLPSVYNITSIGSDDEPDNSVTVLAVQYGMLLLIVTATIIRYTLIAPPTVLGDTTYFIVYLEEGESFVGACQIAGAPRPIVTESTTASGDITITRMTSDFDIDQPSVLPFSITRLIIDSVSFPEHNATYVCNASNTNPQTGEEAYASVTLDIVVLGKHLAQ